MVRPRGKKNSENDLESRKTATRLKRLNQKAKGKIVKKIGSRKRSSCKKFSRVDGMRIKRIVNEKKDLQVATPFSAQEGDTTEGDDVEVDSTLIAILEELEHVDSCIVPIGNSRNRLSYQEKETDWKSRQRKKEEEFIQQRGHLQSKLIEFSSLGNMNLCMVCKKKDSKVRCRTCRTTLCGICDYQIHVRLITHNRVCELNNILYVLSPCESLDENGLLMTSEVPLPLFEPTSCNSCGSQNSIHITCGSKRIAVITKEGRFDINSTLFQCDVCSFSREATNEEYMCSGYWPGSLSNTSYYFEDRFLQMWYHLRHKTPGTSEGKFIEAFEEISLEDDRINIINKTLFSRSRREYEYSRHRIEKDILRRHGKCKACGPCPHGVHADANMKLYRLSSAKDREGESLFGEEIMASDKQQFQHQTEIEKFIPQAKNSAACGSSSFKAARADSSQIKNLDITGTEMMSCTHGTILHSANLFIGETYKHTHLQHIKAKQLNATFFCSDVICKYWSFAKKVATKFPTYGNLLTMKPFLSRFHGKAHPWDCMVLWNGHWQKGAGDMLGEEQEQVFSVLSRKASTTKHASRSVRRDDLSASFFYWNAEKERRMISALCKWYQTAREKAPEYEKKLSALLSKRSLSVEQLPGLLKTLKRQAKIVKAKNLSGKWNAQQLQREIEGECHMMRVLQARNAKFLDTCKARTANRKIMSKKKKRIAVIVNLLKSKGIQVTPENIEKGMFPWQNSSNVSVADDYEVIDAWMLGMRYREAITQNKAEMTTFIKSLQSIQNELLNDITIYSREDGNKESLSRSLMARTEINRLNRIIQEAAKNFIKTLRNEDDSIGDEEDFWEKIEYEDNILDAMCDESDDGSGKDINNDEGSTDEEDDNSAGLSAEYSGENESSVGEDDDGEESGDEEETEED